MFQLIRAEFDSLRFQTGTLETSGRGQHRKYLPYVFTEQGAAMVSFVLKSERAVDVNIAIMRAFVEFRRSSENPDEMKEDFEILKSHIFALDKKYDHQSNLLLEAVEHFKQINVALSPKNIQMNLKEPSYCRIEDIQKTVARFFKLKIQDLKSSSRNGTVAHARQIGMYLIREKFSLSFKEIGHHFGGRDHTTVIHAYGKIKSTVEKNPKVRAEVENILRTLSV